MRVDLPMVNVIVVSVTMFSRIKANHLACALILFPSISAAFFPFQNKGKNIVITQSVFTTKNSHQ